MTDNNTSQVQTSQPKRVRWSWFPSLLFGDGLLPSVFTLTLVMFRRYGLNNAQTALYISILATPFIMRPLFEMTVAHFRGTNKVWIISSEFIAALSLWAIAFTLPTDYWWHATMCFMPFVVVSGEFHKVAVNRFYIEDTATMPQQHHTLSILFRYAALLFGMGAAVMLAGNMEVVTRNIRYSWSFVFYLMAGVEFFLWLWHSIFLPGTPPQHISKDTFGLHRSEYGSVADSITQGFRNHFMLYFLVLFILPEAFMSVVMPLFIVDAPHNGGLGLSPQEFGLAYGTVGVIGMFAGYVLGCRLTHMHGLRAWMLPLAAATAAHGVSALYLSSHLAAPLGIVCLALLAAGAALGLGLSAYNSAIERFAATARGMVLRRSAALGIVSLTSVLAGMCSGLIQMSIGYRQFFMLAIALYAATITAAGIYTFAKSARF